MNRNHQGKIILALSLPLSVLTIIVSCVGLFKPHFYSLETLNWQAQSTGQDIIDLFFIVPCLVTTSILAYRNNKTATMIWGGVLLYLTYTFTLYCFDIHFNKLFVLYCLCLCLSFYSLIYFFFTQRHENNKTYFENKSVVNFIGYYFLVISALFYFLWLSEIIPAIIQHTNPESIVETGLFTNGVQVIDLSVFLPGIAITGIFLLKRISVGFILAPVILTFFFLMDITIGVLTVIMIIKGVEGNLMVTAIMSLLALISLWLLIRFFRNIKPVSAGKLT